MKNIDNELLLWDKGFMVENTTIEEESDRYNVCIASIEKREINTGRKHKTKDIYIKYGKFSEDLAKIIPHL